MIRSVLNLASRLLRRIFKIIAAVAYDRYLDNAVREDEIEYCKKHGIDLPFDTKHSYSRDRNLWHISHEGLELEDSVCRTKL